MQEAFMAIELNHTIVPARDKVAAAKFFARISGLRPEATESHCAPVRENESHTMDFGNRARFESHQYAFKVSEEDFNAIFGRVEAEGIPCGSGSYSLEDRKVNHRGGGRGVYFRDPNGHVLFAFVRLYPTATRGVMILDVPLPGLEPWEEDKAKPMLWHFAFHQTPSLPEK